MALLNKHHGGVPAGAVYIGRGSRWGNPFVIGRDGDRQAVIDKHKAWLREQYDKGRVTMEDFNSLYGKDLVCFCAPLGCHGQVLIEAAEWAHRKLGN